MSDHQAGIMQETIECRRPAISKQLIYGSSRFGLWDRLRQEISHPETGPAPPDDSPPIDDPGIDPGIDPGNDETVALSFEHVSGFKRYELTIHLGNVLTTVSDRKLATELGGNTADIISTQDYYPFGSLMPGRNWNSGGYRFGYSGQEKDDEITGTTGSHLNFKYRMYDSRIARFFAVDPMTKSYPWYTPYQFAGNMPIWARELEGLEPAKTTEKKTTTDAGHGDKPTGKKWNDPGTVDGKTYEKDIALKVEQQVDYWLGEFGIDNERTRTGDISNPGEKLKWRIKKATEHGADVFVSIHLDAGDKEGMFSIYMEGKQSGSRELAKMVAEGQTVLSLKGTGYASTEEVGRGSLYVLSAFKGDASIIIELGGIANENTIKLINTKASDIGYDIAKAVYQFMYKNVDTDWKTKKVNTHNTKFTGPK